MGKDRDERRRLTAPFKLRNYRAVLGMARVFVRPTDALRRYVGSGGSYPWRAKLRTPSGRVVVELPTNHDVRTVNEVFCREDYGDDTPRVVVDIGANIGISALYFLTRRPDSVVYAYEPVESNAATLRRNLGPFVGRWHLFPNAVAVTPGPATFLTEPIGRYGGLAEHKPAAAGHIPVTVQCLAISDVLRSVIDREGRIDLVKIDTEGSESALVDAIPADLWSGIMRIAFEDNQGHVRSIDGPQ